MASTDGDFETKAADIIGLCLDPPRHAAVFCVNEKIAIQAIDHRDRVQGKTRIGTRVRTSWAFRGVVAASPRRRST